MVLGIIIEHKFLACQGEDVAGWVYRRERGERGGGNFKVQNENAKGGRFTAEDGRTQRKGWE